MHCLLNAKQALKMRSKELIAQHLWIPELKKRSNLTTGTATQNCEARRCANQDAVKEYGSDATVNRI